MTFNNFLLHYLLNLYGRGKDTYKWTWGSFWNYDTYNIGIPVHCRSVIDCHIVTMYLVDRTSESWVRMSPQPERPPLCFNIAYYFIATILPSKNVYCGTKHSYIGKSRRKVLRTGSMSTSLPFSTILNSKKIYRLCYTQRISEVDLYARIDSTRRDKSSDSNAKVRACKTATPCRITVLFMLFTTFTKTRACGSRRTSSTWKLASLRVISKWIGEGEVCVRACVRAWGW